MNRFVMTGLLASFGVIQPIMSVEVLPTMKRAINLEQFIEQTLSPSGVFDLDRAQRFLFQLKQEVKEKYDVSLNFNLVLDESLKIMNESGIFSELEIATAKGFYSQLIEFQTEMSYECRIPAKSHKNLNSCTMLAA